jgi:8-oxo-dGTP pyrophosphatase MutT (NUDIX family)
LKHYPIVVIGGPPRKLISPSTPPLTVHHPTMTDQKHPLPFTHSLDVSEYLHPPANLLADASTTTDALAVGAFIFSPDNKLLLLRRAATDTHPNEWEVPGGGCDPGDETLLHALAREVKEEAGLEVTHIERFAGTSEFKSSKGLRIKKYAFVVEVNEGQEVRTDQKEHSEARWCSWEEVEKMEITTTMHREEMRKAFVQRLEAEREGEEKPVWGKG